MIMKYRMYEALVVFCTTMWSLNDRMAGNDLSHGPSTKLICFIKCHVPIIPMQWSPITSNVLEPGEFTRPGIRVLVAECGCAIGRMQRFLEATRLADCTCFPQMN